MSLRVASDVGIGGERYVKRLEEVLKTGRAEANARKAREELALDKSDIESLRKAREELALEKSEIESLHNLEHDILLFERRIALLEDDLKSEREGASKARKQLKDCVDKGEDGSKREKAAGRALLKANSTIAKLEEEQTIIRRKFGFRIASFNQRIQEKEGEIKALTIAYDKARADRSACLSENKALVKRERELKEEFEVYREKAKEAASKKGLQLRDVFSNDKEASDWSSTASSDTYQSIEPDGELLDELYNLRAQVGESEERLKASEEELKRVNEALKLAEKERDDIWKAANSAAARRARERTRMPAPGEKIAPS